MISNSAAHVKFVVFFKKNVQKSRNVEVRTNPIFVMHVDGYDNLTKYVLNLE